MKDSPRPIPPKPDPRDGRIAELERALSDRQSEIDRLRGTAGQVSSLEDQLRRKDQEISSLQSLSSERDRLTSEKDRLTSEKDRLASEKDRLASEKDRLTGEKDRLTGRIADLEQQLSSKDQELGGLRGQAADSNRTAQQLAALQGQLSTKHQELAALKTGAEDRNRLSSELAQAKQRVAELERQLMAKDQELAALKGAAADRDRVTADLAAARQRSSDLEGELSRRDQEMAGLKGALDQQRTTLAQAKDDLSKLLQAEVAKGNVTMKQLGDQLTLGLATTLLFDSGESSLKPGGMDVLKRIGGVLKQYPDRSIHVAGHTDNVPIRGALAKKFPTNQELSQARAESARQALIEGGMTVDRIDAMGHADSRPIASNSTVEGRQRNRRVEIVVKQ
ncbi:MAG: OmpA family protein [Nitrospiraceae bacterium]